MLRSDPAPVDYLSRRPERAVELPLELPYSLFAAINNPSIALYDGRVVGVARADSFLSGQSVGNSHRRYENREVLFFLGPSFEVAYWCFPRLVGFPPRARIFDLRLFVWRDQLWCSHPIESAGVPGTRHGLSMVDFGSESITFVGTCNIDGAQLQHTEKNWGFFARGQQLYCVYAIHPKLVVLRADPRRILQLHTAFEWNTSEFVGFLDIGPFVSLSSPPIEVSRDELVLSFHQHRNYRDYRHYLLKLDANSMRPINVTREPWFRKAAAPGPIPGIVVVMNGLRVNQGVVFSYGQSDRESRLLVVPRDSIADGWDEVEMWSQENVSAAERLESLVVAYRTGDEIRCASIARSLLRDCSSGAQPVRTFALAVTALMRMKQRRQAEAVVLLDECIRAAPANRDLYHHKANALRALGRYDEAESAFAEALRIDPGFADGYRDLGDTFVETRQFGRARRAYLSRYGMYPMDARNLYKLSILASQCSRIEEALGYITKIRSIRSLPGEIARLGSDLARRHGKVQESREAFLEGNVDEAVR